MEASKINSQIVDYIDEVKASLPKDMVEEVTGAKTGSEEHSEQNKLIDTVKETNSTKRVNRTLTVLKWVGYMGLLISLLVKFTGIVYDINFHVPFLFTVIGDIGVAILGVFITIVIVVMTHLTSDGLVNNKWKTVPRLILVWLVMLGLSASFYFDYRAITNYTVSVMEKVKIKKMESKTDIAGIEVSSVQSEIDNLNKSVERYQNSLDSIETRLTSISGERTVINSSIERVKQKKESSNISNKELKKLNQNIYTSRKQLSELEKEEEKLTTRQANLINSINTIQKEIGTKTGNKIDAVKSVDSKMDNEQFHRFLFLFILVVVIEVVSFGGLLSDFLGNKNIEVELKDKLDTLRNNTNLMGVINSNLSMMEANQAQQANQELGIRGAVNQVYALSAINNIYRQGESVKSLVSATNKIGDATNELTNLAVEGIANNIVANLESKRADKLQDLLNEPK
jgi:hypothetical protein